MIFFQAHKLAKAIDHADHARLEELLQKGANTEACEEYGRKPLERAVWRGNAEAVKLLLAHNAQKDMSWHDGSLLHLAANYGRVEIAEMLLKKWPEMLKDEDHHFNTALHTAAESGYAEMVTFLIDKGIDPATKNMENRTALFLAQKNKHQDVVDILSAFQEKVPPPKPTLPKKLTQAEEQAGDGWAKLADDRIAHVAIEKEIGYRVTEIFNFAARERTTLYQNMATKVETAVVRNFDDIAEKSQLEEALAVLQQKGGTATIGGISGLRKP